MQPLKARCAVGLDACPGGWRGDSMLGNCFQDREESRFSYSERLGREEKAGENSRDAAISTHAPSP